MHCRDSQKKVLTYKKRIIQAAWAGALAVLIIAVTGCGKTEEGPASAEGRSAAESGEEITIVQNGTEEEREIMTLSPDSPLLSSLENLPEPEPEYLRGGAEHSKVATLQGRLMELGFMENDEPTQYYGPVTEAAVKSFQRQNELAMDGIAGPATWDAIMTPDAKYYAVSKGVSGEDIKRIQNRLYELGYLSFAELVTGMFDDSTEAAVLKLQEINGLNMDGKVGQQTINLMFSEDIKPNFPAYGEKSDLVFSLQVRLQELGYLSSAPDGAYGNDTAIAVKQFQSRNDLIVDGYLGPSTRAALNDPAAQPNGLTLGEQGEAVERVQQLLNQYGYLSPANVTGYYGEITEQAVKSFQSKNNLTADGSVGKMTMNKLAGGDARKAASGGGSSKNNTSGSAVTGSGAAALVLAAKSKVGSPYVYGSKGPNSFDCSGFVYWSLNQAGVKQSYLTSSGWRKVGKYTKITSFSNLKAGDVIVVKGHVGIVAGGGQVVDASSSHGRVVLRSLSTWWSNNFICGWRIFG